MKNTDSRREFLKSSSKALLGAVALASLGTSAFAADSKNSKNKAMQNLPSRILGKDEAALEVSALGLGCMGMSANHGVSPAEKDMIKLLHEAYELGVRYFDTAEIYGPHTNEILLGKAFKDRRDKVVIGTKFGLYYPFGVQQQDSSKKSIFRAVDESLNVFKQTT